MKIVNKYSTIYSSPAINVVTVEAEGLLCTSAGELDNLLKGEYEFSWEN